MHSQVPTARVFRAVAGPAPSGPFFVNASRLLTLRIAFNLARDQAGFSRRGFLYTTVYSNQRRADWTDWMGPDWMDRRDRTRPDGTGQDRTGSQTGSQPAPASEPSLPFDRLLRQPASLPSRPSGQAAGVESASQASRDIFCQSGGILADSENSEILTNQPGFHQIGGPPRRQTAAR